MYERAAEQDYTRAKEILDSEKDSFNISMYLRKRGDLPRAKWWLEKAAEQGYALAQYSLARMYLSGAGWEEDELLAKELMKQMAEQGYAPAQHNLARMYLSGAGWGEDEFLTRDLLEKAAEQGYFLSQLLLSLYIGKYSS